MTGVASDPARGTERVRLTLASASPARREVLRRAGIDPEVVVSDVDEEAVVAAAGDGLTPADAALLLGRAKCEAVAADPGREGTLVLGCDSVFEMAGAAYGKPGSPAVAAERWQRMSGSSGVLHTGHWLIDRRSHAAEGRGCVVSTELEFAEVTDAEIQAYVATGEPLGCAGGFTIDGIGGAFVRRIAGDHLNVIGLSLPALRTLLADIAIPWPSLWTIPEMR